MPDTPPRNDRGGAMKKATLEQRLLAAADWVERVDESPIFQKAVWAFLWFAAGFFGKVIIDIFYR